VLLVVECMGASTVLIYGLHLLYDPVMEDFVEDPNCPGKPLVSPLKLAQSHVHTKQVSMPLVKSPNPYLDLDKE
jgi:hypothetical protein